MNRADSKFIDTLLQTVKAGGIVGTDEGGEVFLQRMVDALQAILKGTPPDEALKIDTRRGRPPTDESILMAYVIHQHKKAGDSWSLIEGKIKEQFPQADLPQDAISDLKSLRKRNLWWLTQQDMFERLRAATK